MNKIKRYADTATPGRSTPWTAIGLGIVGLGLLALAGVFIGGIIAMQPEPPTATPDMRATAQAVSAATAQAEATATAATFATEQAIAATAARATRDAHATEAAIATATADAIARATRDARATDQAIARATDDAAFTATAVARATDAAFAPTATALALEAALNEAVVVFEDNFDSNVNGWELGEEQDEYAYNVTSIDDGKYRQYMWSLQSLVWREHVPDVLLQDFYFSVEATMVETSALAENVNIDSAHQPDFAVIQVDPFFIRSDDVLIGVFGIDAQVNNIVHDLKNTAA